MPDFNFGIIIRNDQILFPILLIFIALPPAATKAYPREYGETRNHRGIIYPKEVENMASFIFMPK